ncbi:YIP1 family protein [Porticoccaceae bacterium]|nr:YIP1 family protein [Porticoccaceae bacterium]
MSSNPLKASLDILISPNETFSLVKDKKNWSWVPFGLVSLATAGLFLYYFSSIDFDWMLNQMLEQIAIDEGLSDEELQITSQYMTKSNMMWSTTIGALLGTIVVNIVMALYYFLVTRIATTEHLSFGKWHGFVWWISMPLVVSYLLAFLIIIFSTNGMVTLEDLSPTSLGFLSESSSRWFGLFNSLNIFSFWTVALAFIGLRAWLGVDQNKALAIASGPTLTIYGIWTLYLLTTG